MVGVLLESRLLVLEGSRWYLLQLVVVDTHEWNLCAAALVELVAARLAAESLEQQLPAEVAEGQREEGLPHLQGATVTVLAGSVEAPEIPRGSGENTPSHSQSCALSEERSPEPPRGAPPPSAMRCPCPSQWASSP